MAEHESADEVTAATLTAIRRRALTASTYAEWHQVGRDIETLADLLAAANERAETAEREVAKLRRPASFDWMAEISDRHAAYRRSHDHLGAFACCSAHDIADTVPYLLREIQRLGNELGRLAGLNHDLVNEAADVQARLAELGEATEWGQPRTEWTWSARKPDGAAVPPTFPDPHPPRSEKSVRHEFDGVVENMGYRKVLLRREVTAWRDAKAADAPGEALSVTETEDGGHG